MTLVKDRYKEIRSTHIEELISESGIISQWYPYLYDSGINNTALWKYKRGFEKDVNKLSSWLKKRVEWMDSQLL